MYDVDLSEVVFIRGFIYTRGKRARISPVSIAVKLALNPWLFIDISVEKTT